MRFFDDIELSTNDLKRLYELTNAYMKTIGVSKNKYRMETKMKYTLTDLLEAAIQNKDEFLYKMKWVKHI